MRAAGAAGHALRARHRRRRPARRDARSGSLARIGGEEALLVGEDDERIGFEQIGDQRAQRVVVAELDLVGDDRVVLVDDRHDAELEQRHQRRAGVEIALAIGQVGVGQQHLGAADAVLAQRRFRRSAPGPSGRRRRPPAARARRAAGSSSRAASCPRRWRRSTTMTSSRRSRTSTAICRHQSPTARASTPRPSLVTRLEPTLTTMRRARAQRLVHRSSALALPTSAAGESKRGSTSAGAALDARRHVFVDRPDQRLAALARQRRNREDRALPLEALDEAAHALGPLLGRASCRSCSAPASAAWRRARGRTSRAR